jgi:hypothetical protein
MRKITFVLLSVIFMLGILLTNKVWAGDYLYNDDSYYPSSNTWYMTNNPMLVG